jgi:hypothetical protein
MPDWLFAFASNKAAVIVFVVFLFLFLATMTTWLSLQWRLHRRTEIEAALKHDMLNRGMSADDIERVLRASSCGTHDESRMMDDVAA